MIDQSPPDSHSAISSQTFVDGLGAGLAEGFDCVVALTVGLAVGLAVALAVGVGVGVGCADGATAVCVGVGAGIGLDVTPVSVAHPDRMNVAASIM